MPRQKVLRDSDGTTIDLAKEEAEHADLTANAKRVILTDTDGTPFSSANPLNVDTELTLNGDVIIDNITSAPRGIIGRTIAYEDTSFVTGESPRVLDVNTDLTRNGVDGYIVNDGAGNIKVEISNNGSSYGGQHTLKKGDIMDLRNLDIDSIRITWVANSAYRILVV